MVSMSPGCPASISTIPSDVVSAYTTVSELPTAYRLSNSCTGVSAGAEKLLGRALPGTQKNSNGTERSSPANARAASTCASAVTACWALAAAASSRLAADMSKVLPRFVVTAAPYWSYRQDLL